MFPSLPSRLAAVWPRARAADFRAAPCSRGALVATILAISACSTSNVLSLRPDVDVGTQTAAVPIGGGMQDLVPDDPYLQRGPGTDGGQQSDFMQSADGYPVEAAQPADAAQPVEMAQAAGMAQPLDAAPVEAAAVDATPADRHRPDDACRSDRSGACRSGPVDAAARRCRACRAGRSRSRPWSQPRSSPPIRASTIPMSSPRIGDAGRRGRLPPRAEAPRRGLQELPPINDGGSCQIDHPIKVSGLPGSIAMKPAATLNCQMAATFARWTRKELVAGSAPALLRAASRRSTRCRAIRAGASTARTPCPSTPRAMRSTSAASSSAAAATSTSSKPGLFAFRTRGFLNNVRTDGCEYFTTVLGPGYNYDHRNHFHFDLRPRRNGRHACH